MSEVIKHDDNMINVGNYTYREYIKVRDAYDWSVIEKLLNQNYKYSKIAEMCNMKKTRVHNLRVKFIPKDERIRHHSKRRLDKDMVSDIVKDIENGGDYKSICETYKISTYTYYRILQEHFPKCAD